MEGAVGIVRRLREAGHQALLVGGCVRDTLLGSIPKDYDIATDALPEQVTALFRRVIATGIEHGTVTVLADSRPYEVTTFRRDVACDGRHAQVEPTSSLHEDLARRDFTVNAMAFDPESRVVIDPFHGQADLKSRLIRAVGNPHERFAEDHLRLMRAVRFAAQLDFDIEPETWRALSDRASLLSRISRERVTDELWALLAAHAAPRGISLLRTSGMLAVVLPEVASLEGVGQPAEWHHLDVLDHSLLALEHAARATCDPITRLAVLLHDIGKPASKTVDESGRIHFFGHDVEGANKVEGIVHRMKLASSRRVPVDAKSMIRRLQTLIRLHLRPFALDDARPPALRRFVREAGLYLDELLIVARCDRLAHREPDLEPLDRLIERLAELGPPDAIRAIDSPLSGQEIMELLGLPPGPAVGRAKEALVAALLDGQPIPDRDAAREWLRAWKRST